MNECTIDGCDKPVKAKGLCSMHHQRWRRHGDPLVTKVRQSMYPDKCQWTKCDRPTVSKGFCSRHYYIKRTLVIQ